MMKICRMSENHFPFLTKCYLGDRESISIPHILSILSFVHISSKLNQMQGKLSAYSLVVWSFENLGLIYVRCPVLSYLALVKFLNIHSVSFIWLQPFDLSYMGGPLRNLDLCYHSCSDDQGMQPPYHRGSSLGRARKI
jgi:hypothetical protein